MGMFLLLSLFAAAATTPHYVSAQKKLHQIESHQAPARSTVAFTHAEINEYARVRARELADGAVRSPRVELRHNAATAAALVDFAKLREAGGEPPGMVMRWLLSGERPVRVMLRLDSRDGLCTVHLERVEVSGVGIEGRGLDFLIGNFVTPLYPDAQIGQPFEMDHRVERIDVRPNSVFVRIGE
jgi:hypothetical protein